MNVLFICTGNTCRSPMAEAIFNKCMEDNNKSHRAYSRGINVFFPQPVNAKAVLSLKNMNVFKYKTSSEQLKASDVENADLILTMTSSHKLALKNAFPKHKDKIYTLKEKAYGKDSDITDPYGQSQQIYDECSSEIKEAIGEILCTI